MDFTTLQYHNWIYILKVSVEMYRSFCANFEQENSRKHTAPKPNTQKTLTRHRESHTNVLRKSSPSRVHTRMLTYNKYNK